MKALRILGALLVVACIAGFLTVADDLRHVGELIGVSTIGVAGLVLFFGAHAVLRLRRRRPPLTRGV